MVDSANNEVEIYQGVMLYMTPADPYGEIKRICYAYLNGEKVVVNTLEELKAKVDAFQSTPAGKIVK